MLKLDSYIKITKNLLKESNITEMFSEDDLKRIGEYVHAGFARDLQSRSEWEKRTSSAMDLALQITKPKTFPWPNCSNVAFPLVTIATLQFHAIAYPAVVSGNDIVKCRVVRPDQDGKLQERANRIAKHMSFQVMEEDKAWEEQHDRLLINLPIVGCAFKKSYYSSDRGCNISELVLAKDLVLDYYATSVDACARKTHMIQLYRNEIYERVKRGVFRDILGEDWYKSNAVVTITTQTAAADNRDGTYASGSDYETPFDTLEQHCSLDLDNDGYAEPYIVTIERNSRQVLRIVTRFDREEDIERTPSNDIIKINATEYFTKYSFIPSPDGGIYDLGFGVLLGPLNNSVNTLINQLIDAGTMATTAGGFLGRGAKLRSGTHTFDPFGWKRLDATGDDLRKSIFPLPVREPSAVLFQLLSLLINYTNRIYGGMDSMVGENPGQNTPAETSRNMITQGMKVYNVIFKRVWRSMKEEFKKLYCLNAVGLDAKEHYGSAGAFVLREDYLGDPDAIVPAADPHIVSDQQRMQIAGALKQAAYTSPGYNIEAVERNYLQSLRVENIDLMYPGPGKVPPLPNPKIQVEQMKLEGKKLATQAQIQIAVAELMEERRVNEARIMKLEAEAASIISGIGAERAEVQIQAFNAAIGALRNHDESLRKHIELMLQGLEHEQSTTNRRGMERMATPPMHQGPPAGPNGMEGGPEGAMG